MADLIKDLVSGVVDAALKEVLKKTGVRSASTRRRKASGGLLADVIEAVLKPEKKPARRARKQVSRRRTAASRSPQRNR
ncbi:hypothetical protein [Shinella zoogloeoides]|uniref:hypothetical protein n=1 Tax=Shinella zoogloeoides TaxID=352475 RepID=UPI000E646981|nr:hypothetical protein [Shinella zoogloeoides]